MYKMLVRFIRVPVYSFIVMAFILINTSFVIAVGGRKKLNIYKKSIL